ncbi:MAG: lipopolysaccharide transport periplasmic protein LptA [Desulfuromonadales bacterium]|nr:lipopolysaccharide transport periplasmic protein LptA [Desulfuromonadales bacterium]
MNTNFLITLLLFLCTASLVFAASPAKSSIRKDRSNLPITIKSSQLSADNRGKTAIFTGKVVAKQGDITIYSDKLTINYGDKKGDVEKIEADGNVRIIQENRVGLASHAVYESALGRITLTGKPRVMQGADTTTGKTITYLIDDERSIVTGDASDPVVTTIHPPTRKDNDPSH